MKYWTCSKFADWVRGTPKPEAATGQGWDEWEQRAKSAHPIRYWLAEEGLDYLDRIVGAPSKWFNDVRYYCNNRFFIRTHALTASPRDIKPGEWCDLGNRFLPCMFNELVNFVEVECARMNVVFDSDAREKHAAPLSQRYWFLRWGKPWRSAASGLDYLKWEMSLVNDEKMGFTLDDPDYGKPTHQALKAQEVIDLYNWWTTVYPNRPDPYDVSGWSEFCERSRKKYGDGLNWLDKKDEDEQAESNAILEKLREIEKQYDDEDEQQMIRLIKIRKGLWT